MSTKKVQPRGRVVAQHINDPSLRRIGSTAGVTRFGKGYSEQLKKHIESTTREILDGIRVTTEYSKVITVMTNHVKTALKAYGINGAIPDEDERFSALRPFNTRGKKKAGEEKKAKAKNSNPQSLQVKNSNRLLIPKKSFENFCRRYLKEITNTKGETTEPRWEATAIPVLQFFVEKRAIALCNEALSLARFSDRETVFGADIEHVAPRYRIHVV